MGLFDSLGSALGGFNNFTKNVPVLSDANKLGTNIGTSLVKKQVTDPTEANAAILQAKLNVSSGAAPSLGGQQTVSIKKITDTPNGSSVKTQNYTVTPNIGAHTASVTTTRPVIQSIQDLATGKKQSSGGSLSLLSGNNLPGSNPSFDLNLGNLPLGGNNTVYLPFGGNNNQQPGSNPYIVMPGGTGTQNAGGDIGGGIDAVTLGIIGVVALGGIYLFTKKR